MIGPPDEIPESLRDLIAAEKARPDPAPEIGQRVYARLAVGLGLPPLMGDAAPPVPPPAGATVPAAASTAATTVAHSTGRTLLTFIVGAAVGATTYGTVQHLRRGPEPLAAPAVTMPAPRPVDVLPAPAAPPAAEPESVKPAAPPPGRASEGQASPTSSRDRGLAAERKLVEMARSALARGHTDGALTALARHARAFPRGQLAEERDSLLVQALVAKGDFGRARERATHFHRHYPQSLFAPVVDQALRSIP